LPYSGSSRSNDLIALTGVGENTLMKVKGKDL